MNAVKKVAWFPPAVLIAVILVQLLPIHGRLGHDYYHFFTRLYIGAAFFWQNGFSIPHYTPSLCGGIPFFADPQSMYYSLPQWLAFVIDPLFATLITVLLFYVLGYVGMFRLGQLFGLREVAAHLGALLFLLNGFSFVHLLVGHNTHHTFLLFPWLLYAIFAPTPDLKWLFRRVALFCLLLIYTFYSGGLHMLVVFAVGFFVAFPCLLERKLEAREGKAFVFFILLSALILAATCSGKLLASVAFSREFAHRGIDSSGAGILELVQRYFWFDPAHTPLYIRFGHMHFGPWEFVGFVSKGILPALFVFPVLFLIRKPRRMGLVVVYLLTILLVAIVASGNAFNQRIPFFRGYHNPIKILAAFIPYLCLITAQTFQWLRDLLPRRLAFSSPNVGALVYLVCALCLVSEFQGYAKFFVQDHNALGYPYRPWIYAKLKAQRGLTPVSRVTDRYGFDDIGVGVGGTSLRCYEPLFGYRRETLAAGLEVGPTTEIRDGAFNISHPGCLLYPSYFHCHPWDRVAASDRAQFTRFIHGESAWGVPPWRAWLLRANFAAIFLLVATFVGDLLYGPAVRRWRSGLRELGRWQRPTLPIEEGI